MKKILSIVLVVVMVLAMVSCGKGEEMTLSFDFGDRTGTYSGDVNEEGLPDGYGTFTAVNELGEKWTYEGEFVNGHFEGEGKTTWVTDSGDFIEVGTYHNDYIQPLPTESLDKAFLYTNTYRDYYVEFDAHVFNVLDYSEGVNYFQAWVNTDEYEHVVLISMDCEKLDIGWGDDVQVQGYIRGTYTSENIFGNEISGVKVEAVGLTW